MKNVVFIGKMVAALSGCIRNTERTKQEERFVNPLFYKQLIPISSTARETYLTPNSLKFSNAVLYKENDVDKTDGQRKNVFCWKINKIMLF